VTSTARRRRVADKLLVDRVLPWERLGAEQWDTGLGEKGGGASRWMNNDDARAWDTHAARGWDGAGRRQRAGPFLCDEPRVREIGERGEKSMGRTG
jgi:hypothetical protein